MDARAAAGVGTLNPPQRGQFLQLLESDLTRCRHSGKLMGLLVIRLSGLGRINRELGYALGDRALGEAVQRIRNAVRPDDLLLRIDGVDFALIMPALRTAGQVTLAARKVASVCAETVRIEEHLLTLSPSVGAALAPTHADTAETFLRCADLARGDASRRGEHLALYTPDSAAAADDPTLQGDFEAALDNNDLRVHFQPKVDLRRGKVIGVEALSRWQHPTRGFVRPDLFVALAERCGLIEPLTRWNLNAALRLQQSHFPALSLAVNLSAVLLNHGETADLVAQAAGIWGSAPGQLTLEVTESAMIDDPLQTLATLHALAAQGVKLAIDDFGTGYSSLAYLRELPVAELKIDKSFVADMTQNPQDEQIVRAVIDLAHNLDMSVVAEGIEDGGALQALGALGCDVGQGYHFARPMALDELLEWLRASPWKPD